MTDQAPDDDCAGGAPPEFPGCLVREMKIVNRKGLHARATAKFVQCVERFDPTEVFVHRCGETVGGASIMGILTLGAGVGSTITVAARGEKAEAALDAIEALVADRFGEEE
jgi:phosphocarrier protein HPr